MDNRNPLADIEPMKTNQMKQAYRKLEGANVARMEGNVATGEITVTYANGYKHTFSTVEDVEAAAKAVHPSSAQAPILGSLLFGIIGAPA
jgi:hypothetical protein